MTTFTMTCPKCSPAKMLRHRVRWKRGRDYRFRLYVECPSCGRSTFAPKEIDRGRLDLPDLSRQGSLFGDAA